MELSMARSFTKYVWCLHQADHHCPLQWLLAVTETFILHVLFVIFLHSLIYLQGEVLYYGQLCFCLVYTENVQQWPKCFLAAPHSLTHETSHGPVVPQLHCQWRVSCLQRHLDSWNWLGIAIEMRDWKWIRQQCSYCHHLKWEIGRHICYNLALNFTQIL